MKYYAVHSDKTHVRIKSPLNFVARLDKAGSWKIVRADSEGWIPHTGTECPLPDDARCDIKWFDNSETKNTLFIARGWYWDDPAITHYRPVLTEQAEPAQGAEPMPTVQMPSLFEQLAEAHEAAAKIPDIVAQIKAKLEKYGHTVVPLNPFVGAVSHCCGNPAQCWEPCGELGKRLDVQVRWHHGAQEKL